VAENTKIQWCDHSWSPWIGCSKIGSGCANCYAEADFDKRRGMAKWGPHGTRVKTSASYWRQLIKWNEKAEASGKRPRVFPSLCDVFEQWGGEILRSGKTLWCDGRPMTMNDVRCDMFDLIDETPNLDWLLLTKRPENVRKMWPHWQAQTIYEPRRLNNVWLIYSASDQQSLDAGLPHLLTCRDLVPVLGVSLEPLIGPVDLSAYIGGEYVGLPGDTMHASYNAGIDWVIVGGESGPLARPCDRQWIYDVTVQCKRAHVPCFVKQLGAKSVYCGDHYPLRDSKGGDPDEWPEDLRVRKFAI
jgi:protein gp37